MDGRNHPDFFDKFAVAIGFLGLGVFFVFSFLAISNYIEGWTIFDNSFSSAGSVVDGNKGAGFLSTALASGGTMLVLVNVAFIRAIHDNWKVVKQPAMATGFVLVMVGRAFMVLTGAFPSGAWGDVHDNIAVAWLAGELFGIIIIAGATLHKNKGQRNKDIAWGILPFILIGAAIPSWIPYAMDMYDIALPEIVTASIMLGYSAALWVRAWQGKALMGKART